MIGKTSSREDGHREEEVYWWLYDSPAHARECLAEFHRRYNHDRPN
jgi:hypothetical protein